MTPNLVPSPRRKPRRRLAFGVGAMMLGVLAIALGLGWKIHRARVQKQAVFRILLVQGEVLFDDEFDGTYPPKVPAKPGDPDWVHARMVDHLFRKVTWVNFPEPVTDDQAAPVADLDGLLMVALRGPGFTDAGLGHLAGLRRLREVRLDRTGVTDAGLARLRPIAGLRRLEISQEGLRPEDYGSPEFTKHFRDAGSSTHAERVRGFVRRRGTAITDAGLAHVGELAGLEDLTLMLPGMSDAGLVPIGRLGDLRSLTLINCGLTDAGMAHLKGMTGLRELRVGESLSDAGLAPLAGLTSLRSLSVWGGTRITDAGLAQLRALDRLEELDLRNGASGVTDAGLAHLAHLSHLRALNLGLANVTDAGLAHLRGLKGLRRLGLEGSTPSPGAIAALEAAIPGLKVEPGAPILPPPSPSDPGDPLLVPPPPPAYSPAPRLDYKRRGQPSPSDHELCRD